MLDQTTSAYAPIPTKDWVITILITAIPFVGLIMLFVWAFGSNSNHPSKINWAKAMLLWYLIGIVLMIIFWAVAGAAIFALSGNGY